MAVYATRVPAGPGDIPQLVDFACRTRLRARLLDYPSVVALPEFLAIPHNASTLRLWHDEGGHLRAFAYVDAFETLRFDLDWQECTPELEREIAAWGHTCLAPDVALYATAHEADAPRLALLARQGFARLHDTIVHLERALALPVGAPHVPPGFTLRPVAGEAEAPDIVALHRAAFGRSFMIVERRLATMRAADYDPALDLVAVTAEGARAAYAMGSASRAENALTGRNDCYADLFAVHPDYRGHGLARALLLALLERLRVRGYETAQMATSSENAAMLRTAQRAGFGVVAHTLRFARTPAGGER